MLTRGIGSRTSIDDCYETLRLFTPPAVIVLVHPMMEPEFLGDFLDAVRTLASHFLVIVLTPRAVHMLNLLDAGMRSYRSEHVIIHEPPVLERALQLAADVQHGR